MTDEPVTFFRLRCMGFRLDSTHIDNRPHMTYVLGHKQDTALEIAESVYPGKWTVWLRSDLAGSRTRFCYLRTVDRVEQLRALILAIADELPPNEERDEAEFVVALNQELADCSRRYHEYAAGNRWPRVPG
jgi:hypothetical protein